MRASERICPVETPAPSYRCHRYPAEIIAHCVRLYSRFPLSYRGVEELMLERGVIVSYESIRRWCLKFGPIYVAGIRRRRPQPRDRWHLDEVFIKMGGRTYSLWRAVDADGMVLDILVQERRNREAAEAFLRRVAGEYPAEPRVIVTDKLASYGSAIKAVLPRTEHRTHKGLKQQGRELPPAHAPAGASPATVRIAWARPTLPGAVRADPRPLLPGVPPPCCRAVPPDPAATLRRLERNHRQRCLPEG